MTRLPPVAAVVFDMDGVLVDSEPMNFAAMRRMLGDHGIDYTEADDRRFRGRRNLDLYAWLRASRTGVPDDDVLDRGFTETLAAMIRVACAPMAGVPAVLLALRERGYRLALASSSAPAIIAETLRALRTGELFAAVVSGVDVARGKPAPDIFVETARRLGVAPQRCLVVEDSRNGMLAARAAGMACVVVPCAATRDEDFREAHARLSSLPALLALLPTSPAR
ncbi:MAG TPA: HAD family phosphatase [Methylomirabilota bacterium]|nr:HAD family phosphatase [Methylomirabilota bacterium]